MSSWPSSAVTPTIWPGCTLAPTTTARSASRERSASVTEAAYASGQRLRRQIPADRGDELRRRGRGRRLPCGPFAAGQIEVRVQVARLLVLARGAQYEPVGVEHGADVGIREQARV